MQPVAAKALQPVLLRAPKGPDLTGTGPAGTGPAGKGPAGKGPAGKGPAGAGGAGARLRPPRRDPAPSRIAYRLQRLWLTPLFRALFRVGLPAFVSVFAVGLFLADPARRAAIQTWFGEVRQSVENRPEFSVTEIEFQGVSDDVARALRLMTPITFPVSSFDLKLEEMRAKLEGLDAVARADLRVAPGGVLQVVIEQRRPALVWRGRTGLELVDATGHRVAGIAARDDRADLPLIAGDGAKAAAPEALDLLSVAAPIAARLRGLVRMGERRWDVVLDRDQRILLPEEGAVAALQRVIALNHAQDLLNRDIVSVDMRNPTRPTLRLAPVALPDADGAIEPPEDAGVYVAQTDGTGTDLVGTLPVPENDSQAGADVP